MINTYFLQFHIDSNLDSNKPKAKLTVKQITIECSLKHIPIKDKKNNCRINKEELVNLPWEGIRNPYRTGIYVY